ncbi:outer membrane protein assembly factor BamE domain-containing protein [Glacieibacterium sp.]|uniref:OmpA family protein n=1 Tax=Glacieibacterium sp. TaxID=2860237 RepID=UPI003B00A158
MKIALAAILLVSSSAAIGQAPLKFPEARHAWLAEGLFLAPDTVRQVKLGMTKAQVRALLGPPHFSEGLMASGWGYLINFRTGQGVEFVTCQMKLQFTAGRVERAAWRDPACGQRIVVAAPVIPTPEIITRTEIVKERADIVIKQYSVLFPFNSDALTGQGRTVIAEAVQNARAEKARKTTVVGSADRSGSDAYNLGLSNRRAKAVATALTAEGVSLADAVVSSTGEDEAAVPTPDGIREAANRRVVITLIR